jgi:ribose transport system substrate-binding protein
MASGARLISCALLLSLLPTGCAGNKKPLIIAVPQTGAEEMWEGMHRGLMQAVSEHGYRRYWNGPTQEHDIDRQIDIVEKHLTPTPQGLVLAPANASSLITTVAEAQQKHIPVVLMESELAIPMGHNVVVVESNNAHAGQMGADFIANATHGHAAIAIVGIDPSSTSNLTRTTAFEQQVQERYPTMRIVEKHFSDLTIESSELQFEHTLANHPEINAIFSVSLNSTRASAAVLMRRHLKDKILLVGCNQDRDIEDLVRQHEVDALIAQDVFKIGYLSALAIVDMNAGRSVPAHTEVEPHLFNAANIDSTEAQHVLVTYSGWDTFLCTTCTTNLHTSP